MNISENVLFLEKAELLEEIEMMKKKYLSMHTIPITKGQGADGRWHTRLPDGRMIRRKNKSDVEKEVIQYYRDLESGRTIDRNITVQEMFLKWIEYKEKNPTLKSETFRKYRNDYSRCLKDTDFGRMKVVRVDYRDIENFLVERTEELGLKSRTVSNLAGYLRNMFNYAVRQKLMDEDPFKGVDLRNNVYPFCIRTMKDDEDRIMTAGEINRLLDRLHEKQADGYYAPDWAIEICIWTGLRVGEVVALQWSDIRDGQIHVTRSERRICNEDGPDEYEIGDTKNHKSRFVPVGKELQDVLDRLKAAQKKDNVYSMYIIADREGRVNAHRVSNAMRRRSEEAGLKVRSIHAIRRTVSSILNTMYDRATVSKILGHTEEVNMLHYDYDTVKLEQKQSGMDRMYRKDA